MNKKNIFNEDLEYYLLREIALRSKFTQFELAKKTYNPQRNKGKKTITLNFIKRKMKEYARLEKESTDFKGKIVFDTSKPDGTPQKLLDVSKLINLSWQAQIDLKQGINSVYALFKKNVRKNCVL